MLRKYQEFLRTQKANAKVSKKKPSSRKASDAKEDVGGVKDKKSDAKGKKKKTVAECKASFVPRQCLSAWEVLMELN